MEAMLGETGEGSREVGKSFDSGGVCFNGELNGDLEDTDCTTRNNSIMLKVMSNSCLQDDCSSISNSLSQVVGDNSESAEPQAVGSDQEGSDKVPKSELTFRDLVSEVPKSIGKNVESVAIGKSLAKEDISNTTHSGKDRELSEETSESNKNCGSGCLTVSSVNEDNISVKISVESREQELSKMSDLQSGNDEDSLAAKTDNYVGFDDKSNYKDVNKSETDSNIVNFSTQSNDSSSGMNEEKIIAENDLSDGVENKEENDVESSDCQGNSEDDEAKGKESNGSNETLSSTESVEGKVKNSESKTLDLEISTSNPVDKEEIECSNANEDSETKTEENSSKTKKSRKSAVVLNLTPRRSSRNLNKQKSYVEKEDEPEIQEITPSDPLADPLSTDSLRDDKENSKTRNARKNTIVVNDTKRLVEIATGSKGMKGGKKEPTLVIIDTNSILSGRGPVPVPQGSPPGPSAIPSSTSGYSVLPIAVPAQGLYPPIRLNSPFPGNPLPHPMSAMVQARPTPPPPPPQPPQILPTLTDDMYVVEAPSFIVPYVYEKPPIKPLKEYLEQLETEIEETKRCSSPPEEEKVPSRTTFGNESSENELPKSQSDSDQCAVNGEEIGKDNVKENGKDNAKENDKDNTKEDDKDNTKEDDKDNAKDDRKDNAGENDEDNSKDDGKDNAKENGKDNAKENEKDNAKENEKDSGKENGKYSAKDGRGLKSENGERNSEVSENSSETEITKQKTNSETKDESNEEERSLSQENEKCVESRNSDNINSSSAEIGAKSEMKLDDSSKSYFDNPLGKFFMQIGINLVQEYVQTDLLRSQKRKREREGKKGMGATQFAINSLVKNLEFSKENNEPFHLEQKKCEYCSFKTESSLVMAQHLETPHMRNYVYRCNFCPLEFRSPNDILFHMEAEHNVRGRLERAPAFHQCPNCPFEDSQKGKLTRHMLSCAKKHKPERNQEPPPDWEPPAKIPRLARSRPTALGLGAAAYQAMAAKSVHPLLPKLVPGAVLPPAGNINRGRGRPPIHGRYIPPDPKATQRPIAPTQVRQNMMYRPGAATGQPQVLLPTAYQIAGSQIYQSTSKNPTAKLLQQPSISITPLPRQPAGMAPGSSLHPKHIGHSGHAGHSPNKATFVICEICDGYIKDLEQLRNHMQWIHKVKIHPKMIYNRPPLNCQKCQFRFFTDQGLERHLLGSHGLVTSSMQEAANKGKDGGRCPVCGRVYQWKLLNHVARDHNMSLKPAHLSYKCTVCTATFGMYKQFENHVYSAHSVVAKRVIDKKSPQVPRPQASETLLKPLKINDEITIIPQPARPRPGPASRTGAVSSIMQQNMGPKRFKQRLQQKQSSVQVIELEDSPVKKDKASGGSGFQENGEDTLNAVKERLRRRKSLEISQVDSECSSQLSDDTPAKKRRRNDE